MLSNFRDLSLCCALISLTVLYSTNSLPTKQFMTIKHVWNGIFGNISHTMMLMAYELICLSDFKRIHSDVKLFSHVVFVMFRIVFRMREGLFWRWVPVEVSLCEWQALQPRHGPVQQWLWVRLQRGLLPDQYVAIQLSSQTSFVHAKKLHKYHAASHTKFTHFSS